MRKKGVLHPQNSLNYGSRIAELSRATAFTLMELMIVVVIIALTAVFSFKAWSAHLVKAEFDSAVNEIIGFFQDARGYAVKNAEVDVSEDTYENSSYTVSAVNGEITLSGDLSGEIYSDSWEDLLTFDNENWEAAYTAPYADFSVDGGGDLEFTVTSTRGDLSKSIIVRASSGIAEIE